MEQRDASSSGDAMTLSASPALVGLNDGHIKEVKTQVIGALYGSGLKDVIDAFFTPPNLHELPRYSLWARFKICIPFPGWTVSLSEFE